MRRTRSCGRSGFSLAELLPVMTIVGIIAALIVPAVSTSPEEEREKLNALNIATINSAVERWYIEKGYWPESLAELESDPHYFPDTTLRNPVTGNPYRLNAAHRAVDGGGSTD